MVGVESVCLLVGWQIESYMSLLLHFYRKSVIMIHGCLFQP